MTATLALVAVVAVLHACGLRRERPEPAPAADEHAAWALSLNPRPAPTLADLAVLDLPDVDLWLTAVAA